MREKNKTMIIVGCTGNSTDEDRARSVKSGQDLFWPKPAPPNDKALADIMSVMLARGRRRATWSQGERVVGGFDNGLGTCPALIARKGSDSSFASACSFGSCVIESEEEGLESEEEGTGEGKSEEEMRLPGKV